MLSEAYKAQAELEVQLNVTRSNLQLVQANNEMLEEALKRNNAAARDVGWRRGNTPQANIERSQSVDYAFGADTPHSPATPQSAGVPVDNRFFKFRFSTASATPTRPSSRPGTPSNAGAVPNLTSPSMPSLTSTSHHAKELEELAAELEKERRAKKAIADEKAALEAELESLSQALFEEVRAMLSLTSGNTTHSLLGEQDGSPGTYEALGNGRGAQRSHLRKGGSPERAQTP